MRFEPAVKLGDRIEVGEERRSYWKHSSQCKVTPKAAHTPVSYT